MSEQNTYDLRRIGREVGEEWARREASPDQLYRLQSVARLSGLTHDPGDAYAAVYAAVANESLRHVDWDEAMEFWEVLLGEDAELARRDGFVSAFVEGAVGWYNLVSTPY
jgi:hypothetical protein